MKLEGVGEGMFTELAKDMIVQETLLLWPLFFSCFVPLFVLWVFLMVLPD